MFKKVMKRSLHVSYKQIARISMEAPLEGLPVAILLIYINFIFQNIWATNFHH
jgi:hypothetical protein